MKLVCCDTSFLFAFYGQDVHTSRAKAAAERLAAPVLITPLNEYEFLQAILFSVFRGKLTPEDAAKTRAAFEADLAAGKLLFTPCAANIVIAEARRLSSAHTARSGHRAFDILHVAAALCLEASDFFSFDKNQSTLAAAEGLGVNSLEESSGKTSPPTSD